MHNKECREVGRLHPSAFYLLNIINDQSLLHKGFPGNTGVWQPCSGILCLKAEVLFRCFTLKPSRLVTKADVGHTAAVQESSVQDRFLNPSFYFLLIPLSLTRPSVSVGSPGLLEDQSFLPHMHVLLLPLPLVPSSRCPCCFPWLCCGPCWASCSHLMALVSFTTSLKQIKNPTRKKAVSVCF